MELREKTLTRQQAFAGKIFDVERRTVALPDGAEALRDVVMTHHATAVVPVTEDGDVILVRQFRSGPEDVMLEIPAGKMEPGEDPALCAARELEEETGCTARELRLLTGLWVSPAIVCECIRIYLAEGLREGEMHPDTGEFVAVERMPLDEACAKIFSGEITDGKTVAGLLMARDILRRDR